MKVKFLGCGAGFNPSYGSNSAYLMTRDDGMILLECGEQTFARLINLPDFLKAKYLTVLLSHTHSDHAGSLGNMVMYSYNVLHRRVVIVAGGIKQRREIRRLLKGFGVARECYQIVTTWGMSHSSRMHDIALRDSCINIEMIRTHHAPSLACYNIELSRLTKDGQVDGLFWSGDTNDGVPAIVRALWGYSVYQEAGVRHSSAHVQIHQFDRALVAIAEHGNVSAQQLRRNITLMHLDGRRALYYSEVLGYQTPELV